MFRAKQKIVPIRKMEQILAALEKKQEILLSSILKQEAKLSILQNLKEQNPDPNKQQNYLHQSGYHSKFSPVAGSRVSEYLKIASAMKTEKYRILHAFEEAVYVGRTLYIIPKAQREKASHVARKIFLDYIKKYEQYGITEENAVDWHIPTVYNDPLYNSPLNRTYTVADGSWWGIQPIVTVDKDGFNENYDGYLPPHIVAYHELMHVEEAIVGSAHKEHIPGDEILTATKTIILLDQVYKTVNEQKLSEEIDYKVDLDIAGKKIPLGKFANFYRELEAKHSNLADAILSSESLEFMKGGNLEFKVLKTTSKLRSSEKNYYPGNDIQELLQRSPYLSIQKALQLINAIKTLLDSKASTKNQDVKEVYRRLQELFVNAVIKFEGDRGGLYMSEPSSKTPELVPHQSQGNKANAKQGEDNKDVKETKTQSSSRSASSNLIKERVFNFPGTGKLTFRIKQSNVTPRMNVLYIFSEKGGMTQKVSMNISKIDTEKYSKLLDKGLVSIWEAFKNGGYSEKEFAAIIQDYLPKSQSTEAPKTLSGSLETMKKDAKGQPLLDPKASTNDAKETKANSSSASSNLIKEKVFNVSGQGKLTFRLERQKSFLSDQYNILFSLLSEKDGISKTNLMYISQTDVPSFSSLLDNELVTIFEAFKIGGKTQKEFAAIIRDYLPESQRTEIPTKVDNGIRKMLLPYSTLAKN